jgi:hypothetical protein
MTVTSLNLGRIAVVAVAIRGEIVTEILVTRAIPVILVIRVIREVTAVVVAGALKSVLMTLTTKTGIAFTHIPRREDRAVVMVAAVETASVVVSRASGSPGSLVSRW